MGSDSADPQRRPAAARLAGAIGRIERSQRVIAGKLGVSPQYLCAVKRGKRRLSHKLAVRLQEVFGIGADWLLTGRKDMIADVAKAARHMDLGPADIVHGAPHGEPGAFELVEMLLRPEEVARRASSTAVPVLEGPPDGRPEASPRFTGAYAKVPDPCVGEFYCLVADGRYEPVFRSGEFLLVRSTRGRPLEPEDIDGRVCVARTDEDAPWELMGLRVVAQGGEVQVEALPVIRRGAEEMTVPWEQLKIAAVAVMAFRARFPVPQPEETVRNERGEAPS